MASGKNIEAPIDIYRPVRSKVSKVLVRVEVNRLLRVKVGGVLRVEFSECW
jgi:hypothetical protein